MSVTPSNLPAEFDTHDFLHTKAIVEWLAHPEDVPKYHVIHVERLREELLKLPSILCRDYGHCIQPHELPTLPVVNSFITKLPRQVWAACWQDKSTVSLMLHRYNADFEAFAFDTDPLKAAQAARGSAERQREKVAVHSRAFMHRVLGEWHHTQS
eukprot:TRINITY_DN10618_c0_g1_i2.p1 TRINITY_DN10618_c0_g1~~TRINITY_DN10618_c0_g1_i2.p1  ORF type:complete len:177 (-),score=11.51 TRINITY_DN10618_c0_g1_i2:34-498(-)